MAEHGHAVYRWVDDELTRILKQHERPPWDQWTWTGSIAGWSAIVRGGGTALAAVDGSPSAAVIGFAVVRFDLTPGMDQLAALFVDAAHRRLAVATGLVDEVVAVARRRGTRGLYVSAVPSDSAVPFYLGYGFAPTSEPDPALLALEPEDIHMTLAL